MDARQSKYRILVADDHALIRHGIRNLLGNNPALKVIGEVGDGEELLEFLRKTVPDLLVLDISMPKLTGIEAVSKVKKLYPEIKILMLTMHKNKQYFYHAMSAGADGYLLPVVNFFNGALARQLDLGALCEQRGQGVHTELGGFLYDPVHAVTA